MSEQKKLTPVMQQYVDIKRENPDALVLFRLGDFYEVFFDDAKTVSDTLGIVLTARGKDENDKDIPMCGIPWHAADNYFGRLVRAGFKIALVEQTETPDQAKARGAKHIDRRVVRVLTPGTLTDENLLNPKTSNFLVAVVPNAHSFDIAGCDISTGEFFIGQSDKITDILVRINPAEIIYPETVAEAPAILQLRDNFKTTPVYEKIYNREDIGQIVSKVFGQNVESLDFRFESRDNLNSQISNLNSGGAVALLSGYIFNTQRGVNITFRAPYVLDAGAQLLIDSATWKGLEIDAPISDNGTCLISVLDRTLTAAGARRLRAYLRTLSGDVGEIRKRQEHIGHLLQNRDVMNGLSALLKRVPDVGRGISRLVAGRGTPRDLRTVVDFMVIMPDIKSVGRKLDSDISAKFADIVPHDMLAGELRFALVDELPALFRDGGIIRDGFDAGLDNTRRMADGAKDTIAKLQAQYAADTKISSMKIKYNNVLGYFIEVPAQKADPLMNPDAGFIHRQTMAGNMRFTTPQLIDLDNEVRASAERAMGMENEIIARFIAQIRNIADDLLNTAELIADADVWCALAECAAQYEWVRPEVTTDTSFDVRGGRHPVIESVLRTRGDMFVKNDCVLDGTPIALLTGPNMAGKSTYLRANALIVVLAHLGSFVPATSAKIGTVDQLFSRVGASDNLAAGQSTFMVEMVETANILNRATKKSFIIFDEIGRGTATYDGMAIAQAVLEYLDDLAPRTLFATHYHELTNLAGCSKSVECRVESENDLHSTLYTLHSVQCLTCEVKEHNNEIIFMHKIIPGVANRSYGIHVARMGGVPKSVVTRAEKILETLECREVGAIVTNVEVDNIHPTESKVEQPKPKTQLSLFG